MGMQSPSFNMQEKSPLLPVNDVCQRTECQHNQTYKQKYKRQIYLFIFIIFVFFLQNGYQDKVYRDLKERYQRHTNHDININSYLSVEGVTDMDDIVAFNQDQSNRFAAPFASIRSTCDKDALTIPYEGVSHFEFDAADFSKLKIGQDTRIRHGSVSFVQGESSVYEKPDVSKVTIDVSLKFNREELQDIFWIEQTQDKETGLYHLVVKSDEAYLGYDACILIQANVLIPKGDDLDDLSLSLATSDIIYGGNLKFKNLETNIANGSIQLKDLAADNIKFAIANGHVEGLIDELSENLSVSIASGHSSLKINKIEQENDVFIKIDVANGHVDLEAPADFDSKFDLSSFVGRRIVKSSKPENIHRKQSGGYGVTTGYYGDNAETKNKIQLSAASGSLSLNYV